MTANVSRRVRFPALFGWTLAAWLMAPVGGGQAAAQSPPENARPAKNDDDLRFWLRNMAWHGFSHAEMAAATGLGEADVAAAQERLAVKPGGRPDRAAGDPLLLLPYPGGRHPRIGFLEGAVRPQRETKVSVFVPWDQGAENAPSYVVVDVPEAIWSNLGLLYLAHTHVPTIWTRQGVDLEPLEWNRRADGSLDIERKLPNRVAFGAKVAASPEAVRMELWLTNGGDAALSDLRVQNCVMLKAAAGFNQQTNDNKVLSNPYVACRNSAGTRWIITAWEGCKKPWANDKCPCMHSDPKFPDCRPGQTQRSARLAVVLRRPRRACRVPPHRSHRLADGWHALRNEGRGLPMLTRSDHALRSSNAKGSGVDVGNPLALGQSVLATSTPDPLAGLNSARDRPGRA